MLYAEKSIDINNPQEINAESIARNLSEYNQTI